MSVWGALAGGFVGTLVLTTILRAASELRLTRIDLPFLLGTAFTADRLQAKALGYALHFLAGFVFALVYYAIFVAINRSGWLLGATLGLVHALFAATALVNLILPLIHPRMGSPLTSAKTTALLEPPGFLMLNYGPQTPIANIIAHVAYGALVGGFTQLAS
jgi:ABC-type polysaccharide/polyol phosphate export permease